MQASPFTRDAPWRVRRGRAMRTYSRSLGPSSPPPPPPSPAPRPLSPPPTKYSSTCSSRARSKCACDRWPLPGHARARPPLSRVRSVTDFNLRPCCGGSTPARACTEHVRTARAGRGGDHPRRPSSLFRQCSCSGVLCARPPPESERASADGTGAIQGWDGARRTRKRETDDVHLA